ncbi:hypothetical protein BDY19DRAFT_983844 [Irpex rosettiformis]|uniref:Uncharacterized protein n=1 Tax=Irpex rosettiformis TaxID=378272 RepID=A0ACB8UB21_9APHY|nr:hypothetical protein BDY19DRAFT_983844 [Irpex rosettiformis]
MSTAPIPQEPSIDESLSKLQVAQPASTQEVSSNPWQDNAESSESIQPSEDTFDPAAVSGFIPTPEPQPMPEPVKHEILEEFDPLVSSEEKAAKEAWETSEAHPPPPPPPPPEDSKPPPPVPTKQESLPEPLRSGSPIPSFPSLAALARTFALPLTGSRPRPRSLDTATAVPSPTTISSFASQQQLPRPPLTPPSQDNPDSGRSTPMSRSKSGEGEPLQFDFQRFLDQMKTKSADPVAKYLRSFLSNFAKRTFTVGDQVKLINDFLNFISVKMRECDVWKNASDAEFENAMEGMEKLVMNRLYDYTFTPQIARMVPPRPITADDLERDHILEQRIALFRWIEPNHLDIPDKHGREGFLMFAQQELLKINHYKAPRDKLICILNCCKVIFGLIRHLQREEGADSFIPILIYVVLKANPEHLLSNVEFINRFRNPTKLQSEAGYYLSSLMGAISFIETLDHTSLSHITEEENVEESIQSLPSSGSRTPDPNRPTTPSNASSSSTSLPQPSSHTGEESAEPLALPTPAQSQTLLSEDAKRLIQRTGDTISKPLAAIGRIFNEVLDSAEESLTALGGGQDGQRTPPYQTGDSSLAPGFSAQQPQPYQPRVRRIPSPNPIAGLPTPQWPPDDSYARQQRPSPPSAPYTNNALAMGPSQPMMTPHPRPVQNLVQSDREFQASLAASRASSSSIQSYTQSQSSSLSSLSAYGGEGMGVGRGTGVSRTPTPRLDIVGMQQEIDRVHENAAAAARETLGQIFPSMDREIVDLVLEANGGDVGKSVEALLEMSGGS